MNKIINLRLVLRDQINTPEASIAVAGRKAHETVRKPVLVNERAELAPEIRRVAHCPIPVANNGLSDKRSKVVVVFPAHALYCNSDVCRGVGIIPYPDLRAYEVWLGFLGGCAGDGGGSWGFSRQVGEVLLRQLH